MIELKIPVKIKRVLGKEFSTPKPPRCNRPHSQNPQATRLPLQVRSHTHDKRRSRAATTSRLAEATVPFDS